MANELWINAIFCLKFYFIFQNLKFSKIQKIIKKMTTTPSNEQNGQEFIKDVSEIEKYRKHWEIEDHWQMKKKFLLAHYRNIPKDKLLCYAQLYVNMNVLQNEYDQTLMNEVKALASKISNS